MRKAIVVIVVCQLFLPSAARPQAAQSSAHTPQTASGPGSVQTIPPQWDLRRLVANAEAADTAEGSKAYGRQLAEMLLSETGDSYIDSFAGRLSAADLLARQGKRKLIPEGVVADAFNDMMKTVHSSLRTDASVVHQLRATLHAISPSLSTVDSHNSVCLPSEAVNLFIQLLMHNGTLENLCPARPDATGRLVQHSCPGTLNANLAIRRYVSSHSRSQNEALYDQTAKVFGM
jgi:hypothetical protein